MTKKIKCPQCDFEIMLSDDAQIGDIVECPGKDDTCLTELEIISINPPVVALIVEEK